MVRFWLPALSEIHPPKPFNYNSNSETLQRCLSLLSSVSLPNQLLQIHAQLIVSGHHRNSYIKNKIVQFCTSDSLRKKHSIDLINHGRYAVKLSGNLEPFSWNNVIRAYATSPFDSQREALSVFLDMRRLGVRPNEHTFPFLFKACASFLGLNEGRQIHGDVVKHGFLSNVYVQNTLIHLYGSCKKVLDSYKVFDEMTGFEPDETTMVIVLSACAELGNLSLGKWIHSQVVEKGMVVNCQLGTALVDMYGKCGAVNYANLVFNRMVYRKLGSAMILGHAGLVEDGQRYFEQMEQVHGIKPMMVHFGAMVDILGRAGRLQEAYDFVTNMPIEADGIVWRALLSACSIHDVNDYTRVGEKVRQRLIELEPKRSGNFVMLANNYSELGLWDKAADLRSRMRERGLKKVAGQSCLEIGGSIFRFFSGDSSSIPCADIFLLLNTLNLHAKMIKYG
ncbi:Pentatricopeptide repeat-containing protein [Sesamum angolense]|uniref:Pentatricopeptide repeat-containing protein n=1 Tax=Sesamum angolense TaxID=2727404 RepID=A0AAE1WGX9_9LAMI|nr:Pentatricopeptide repeat-containing protein [Sesamum angolense]